MTGIKKTVLFIVEGTSDKAALEHIFQKIYRNNRKIQFRVADGDISSDEKVTKDNVEERINDIVLGYLQVSKLKRTDLFQIIQIFDTDGTFIDPSYIHSGSNSVIKYFPNEIVCRDVSKVMVRNRHKAEIMRYLMSVHQIKSTPYEMYYMSSNLDHALYGQQNLDYSQKSEYADAFYEQFLGREQVFIDFLKKDVVNGVPDSFPASWHYIQDELHSLERHTNLHIYFLLHPVI